MISSVEKEFPRAILHLDGDAFFASVHAALDPKLKGKPMVTGRDRGIASSMSYEAKRLGITRAMPIHKIRKEFPQVIIVGSDYDAYVMFSQRMQKIVARYTSTVENYSIDECFADITDSDKALGMTYEEIIMAIQSDIERELGIGVSIGVAPTKVLAKVASKLNKPRGLKLIPYSSITDTLREVPIDMVWGIGRKTYNILLRNNIKTAYDFVMQERTWLAKHFSINIVEIQDELQGIPRFSLHHHSSSYQHSIAHTRTFVPVINNRSFVLSELMKNVEDVFARARKLQLQTKHLSIFIKNDAFMYFSQKIELSDLTDMPTASTLTCIEKTFDFLWNPKEKYRSSGVTLYQMIEKDSVPQDLFGMQDTANAQSKLFHTIDQLHLKLGSKSIYLAGSQASRIQEHALHSQDVRHVFTLGSRRLPIVWLGNAY